MWQIVVHERAVDVLRQLLAADALPHALLVTGPAGIGKTRLALELAKALNCTGAEPPCQRCVHCRQIESGAHPDVVLVERADGKDSITIQQMREVRESASLRPFQGRTKVYIVAGSESLTPQGADALLKTLEEPQPQVRLVLTAIDAEALPATVVSRCRHIALQPVEASRLAAALEERGQEPQDAARLARLARGNVGWSLRAIKQPNLAVDQEQMISRLSETLDLSLDARLQLAESLTADRKDRSSTRRNLELLLLLARDLLLVSEGLAPQLASGQQQETLVRQATRYSLPQIHAYMQKLRVAMERIDQNVDPRLTLEALLVNPV